MIKGAPVISEATAIPEASVTTEVQKYPAEVLRCSCSCFCGDQVQKLLLRFCFVGTLHSCKVEMLLHQSDQRSDLAGPKIQYDWDGGVSGVTQQM